MKKITLLAMSLMLTLTSFAQVTFESNDGDTVVTGDNAVGCGSDNNWGRLFNLSDYTVPADLGLLSGQFGIQSLNGGDVVVNIYSADVVMDPSSFVLLGTQTVTVPVDFVAPGTFDFDFDAPIMVPADAIAIFYEITDLGDSIFIGGTAGNTDGKESWLKSVTCATPSYVSSSSIGFPDAHFFMTLTGDTVLATNDNLSELVSIFPNPTMGVLNVEMPSNITVKSSNLYNLLGQDTGMKLANGSMNISDLARGVYILNVETSAGTLTQKVVKN